MVKSMFAAISGLKAHQQKLDVIGNNIANVNTAGFKSSAVTFRDAVYQTVISSSETIIGAGRNAGVNASQVGFGTTIGSITANFAPGGYSPSSSPLSCMNNGNAFFMVGPFDSDEAEPGGGEGKAPDELSMTRVGEFSTLAIKDEEGKTINVFLVDSNGSYVYGANVEDPGAEDATSATAKEALDGAIEEGMMRPISLFPGEGDGDDEIKIDSYSVDQFGVLTGTDDKGKSYVFGMIGLANIPNPNGMSAESGSYYKTGGNSGNPQVLAADGQTNKILGNALELSNVDLSTELTNMITTQRGFQANSKIITVTDEMLEVMVNMKR